jgi:hypothetical protein
MNSLYEFVLSVFCIDTIKILKMQENVVRGEIKSGGYHNSASVVGNRNVISLGRCTILLQIEHISLCFH